MGNAKPCDIATVRLVELSHQLKRPIELKTYATKLVKPWLDTLQGLEIKAVCLHDTTIMKHLNPEGVHLDTRAVLNYLDRAITHLLAKGYRIPYQVLKRSKRPYLTTIMWKDEPRMAKIYFGYALVDWEWFTTLSVFDPERLIYPDQICNCLVSFMGRRIIF